MPNYKLPCDAGGRDLDPESPYVRFWGTAKPCSDKHTIDKTPEGFVDMLYWVRLGRDTNVQPCSEWLDALDTFRTGWPSLHARWDDFLSCVNDGDGDKTTDKVYFIKVPHLFEPEAVWTPKDLTLVLEDLTNEMSHNPSYFCKKRPPVLLICTGDQLHRCKERDWVDCVWREAALFKKASQPQEAQPGSSQVRVRLSSSTGSLVFHSPPQWVKKGEKIKFEVEFGESEQSAASSNHDDAHGTSEKRKTRTDDTHGTSPPKKKRKTRADDEE